MQLSSNECFSCFTLQKSNQTITRVIKPRQEMPKARVKALSNLCARAPVCLKYGPSLIGPRYRGINYQTTTRLKTTSGNRLHAPMKAMSNLCVRAPECLNIWHLFFHLFTRLPKEPRPFCAWWRTRKSQYKEQSLYFSANHHMERVMTIFSN